MNSSSIYFKRNKLYIFYHILCKHSILMLFIRCMNLIIYFLIYYNTVLIDKNSSHTKYNILDILLLQIQNLIVLI